MCGAAGGLGFGLKVFLGARMESGFEIFAARAELDEKIAKADLVVTGEGAIDRQSLMGKGTGRMAQRCQLLGKRCIGLAGMVEGGAQLPTSDRLFHSAHGITPTMTNPAAAKKDAAKWLELLANKFGTDYDWS